MCVRVVCESNVAKVCECDVIEPVVGISSGEARGPPTAPDRDDADADDAGAASKEPLPSLSLSLLLLTVL
jgi:hypothetical protein